MRIASTVTRLAALSAMLVVAMSVRLQPPARTFV